MGDQEGPPEAGPDTVAHLEAVHRLSAAVVAATTVELIYEAALDALIDSLAADRAAILLFDPDGVIRFKASRGLSDVYRAAAEGHTPWSPDETAAEPVVMPDVAGEEGLRQLAVEALRASEARLTFLAAASRRLLRTSLEPRAVLEEAADLVVPDPRWRGIAPAVRRRRPGPGRGARGEGRSHGRQRPVLRP